MRNVPWTGNECNQIIGTIDDGKKYPFGCVKQTDYDDDMEVVSSRIDNVGVVASRANTTAQQNAANIIIANNKIANNETLIDTISDNLESDEEDIESIQNDITTLQINLSIAVSKENTDYAQLTNNINSLVTTTSYIGSKLPEKSDISYVNTELNKKADSSYVNTELNKKANKSYVDTELSKKSDKAYVDTKLSEKSDISYVNTELNKKADASSLNNYVQKSEGKGLSTNDYSNSEKSKVSMLNSMFTIVD